MAFKVKDKKTNNNNATSNSLKLGGYLNLVMEDNDGNKIYASVPLFKNGTAARYSYHKPLLKAAKKYQKKHDENLTIKAKISAEFGKKLFKSKDAKKKYHGILTIKFKDAAGEVFEEKVMLQRKPSQGKDYWHSEAKEYLQEVTKAYLYVVPLTGKSTGSKGNWNFN